MNDRARIQISWIFLALGGVMGISKSPFHGISTLGSALLTGYVFWAIYWGFPAFWRLWKKLNPYWKKLEGAVATGWLLLAVVFSLFLTLGSFYCVSGGGIYQFTKAWRSTRP
jgi:hypothetical protein